MTNREQPLLCVVIPAGFGEAAYRGSMPSQVRSVVLGQLAVSATLLRRQPFVAAALQRGRTRETFAQLVGRPE